MPEEKTARTEKIFASDGEMGVLMRSHDWSKTPLGAVENWPQSLRTIVSVLLNSCYPMFIFWGSQLIKLYNDAYRPILGSSKHPEALGKPGPEVWPEIWETIGPMVEQVITKGEATWSDNLLLFMQRSGYLEEVYFTFSYSPIQDETGGVGGMFCACTETTQQVLSNRRLQTLRSLSDNISLAKTVEEACQISTQTLSTNPYDIPLALLYLVDTDGKQARLAGNAGIEIATLASPTVVDWTQGEDCWNLRQVCQTKQAVIIENLGELGVSLPEGVWNTVPSSAVVMPLAKPTSNALAQIGQPQPLAGLLIMGISPRREFDEEYRGFFDLVTSNVATAIANARAYEAERQRAEALAELDRAKTTFFTNISHEFRTPLTLMLSPIEEMANTCSNSLSPEHCEQLQMVHRNGLRLLKLVNTLLDFSRIEADRIQAVYEPTDLATLTADLAGVFRSAIEQAGMQLVVDCSSLPEPIYVDREMWEKIVLNLLSNAFKFTFEGEIVIALSWANDHIELEVRDTGTGIPAEQLPHIFERFHRVQGARGRTYEGSGIGLSLVQDLVRLHGGTIQVSSEIERGTSFIVSIPTGYVHLPSEHIRSTNILTSTTTSAAPYVEEALRWLPEEGNRKQETGNREESYLSPVTCNLSSSSARILLVDDNADMRDYVKRLLSQQYEVEVVADGMTALATIRQHLPDLVLTDVMMPGLDGFELLRELRNDPQTKELPVILLSARAGEESRIEGLEAGADDYLTKPFSARELLARVEANLKLTQLRQEATQREQALRQEAEAAKQEVENILSSINDGFFVVDHQWRYTYTNDRNCNLIKMQREEMLGKNIWDLFSDVVGDDVYVQFQRAMTEQRSIQFEYFYPTWNSWFEFRVYPSPHGLATFVTEISDRKRSEAALRESEARFKSFAENSNDVIWITDAHEYRLIYVSPSYEKVWGRSATEIYQDLNRFLEFVHPDDRDRLQTAWQQCNQREFSLEYRVIRPDDSFVWIYDRGFPVYDAQGELLYLGGIAEDITERKQTELMLVEQKRLLELIASGQPLDECLSAVCASISKLNPGTRACILLADAQRLKFKSSITPDLSPSFGQGLKDAPINELAIGTCGEAVYSGKPVICADIAHDDHWSQEWRDLCVAHGILACHSAPVMGIDGLPFGSVMLCFDEARMPTAWEYQLSDFGTQIASIAFERDQASLALQGSEELKQRILESSSDCIKVLNLDSEILYINTGGLCLLEIEDPTQVLNTNWLDFWQDEDQERIKTAIAAAQAGNRSRVQGNCPTCKGIPKWWDIVITPVRDASGQVIQLVVTSRDITQQKQAEDLLRDSEEQFRNLANNAPFMVWVTDPSGYCTYLSQSWYDFTGQTEESGLGFGWLNRSHPDDREYAEQIFLEAHKRQEAFRLEYRLQRQDGEYI
jgi:PAS domain S-box-containing protein